MRLVCPTFYDVDSDPELYPRMERADFVFEDGHIFLANNGCLDPLDVFKLDFVETPEDMRRYSQMYRKMLESNAVWYNPPQCSLIDSKGVLVCLHDDSVREHYLGRRKSQALQPSILPAHRLREREADVRKDPEEWVMKRAYGCAGDGVYVGRSILGALPHVKDRRDWIVQKRVRPNVVAVDCMKGRRKKAIADLGVYVAYDWGGDDFSYFAVTGFLSRGSANGYKVNINCGGMMIPVLIEKPTQ